MITDVGQEVGIKPSDIAQLGSLKDRIIAQPLHELIKPNDKLIKPAKESLSEINAPDEAAKNLEPSIDTLRKNLKQHLSGLENNNLPFTQTYYELMNSTKDFAFLSEIASRDQGLEMPKGYVEAKNLVDTLLQHDEQRNKSAIDARTNQLWTGVEIKSKALEDVYDPNKQQTPPAEFVNQLD